MKESRLIMGMPVSVDLRGGSPADFDRAFGVFESADERFSPFKPESELSRINRGELSPLEYSEDLREVLQLSKETNEQSNGYFDIKTPDGSLDPSGLVKGWAIQRAADLLADGGFEHFLIDAGGDMQTAGRNATGEKWRIGIRDPHEEGRALAARVALSGEGIATSGTYLRGEHIYDPKTARAVETPYASVTVIGPNVFEADRFATAAFAMGENALAFIERLPGFEAYAVGKDGAVSMTSGFARYLL